MSTQLCDPDQNSTSAPVTPNAAVPASPESALAPSSRSPARRWWLDWRLGGILLLVLVSLPLLRAIKGDQAHGAPALPAPLQAVAVVKVTREDLFNEISVPAEFKPYLQVELHAKVSGYVKELNVDIGDRVKAGQVLATLEVPELLDQLHSALAVEQRAQAKYPAAHSNYLRLLAVAKSHPSLNLVPEQDLDAARARDGTAQAAIEGAKAERERYQTLLGYTRLTAPFDGVVTRRYADPGSLIQAGTTSDTQSKPLVRVSDNYRLRVDFPVSVAYVRDIHDGDRVEVQVESLGGKKFTGVIARNARKVDEDTRSMITELEVDNPNLELVPGMYAQAQLKVQARLNALAIPVEAVSHDNHPTVYVVNEAGQIEQRPVTLGLETANRYEVLQGLQPGELVLIGGRAKVKVGQKVEPKLTDSLVQR